MTFPSHSPDDLLGPLNDTERENAPETLYTAGDIGILRQGPRVAIVGSRKASPQGVARARRLVKLLLDRTGAVIVSGLAEGIDTAAHEAAIELGGKTIAVIGTPLDRSYPKKNESLQQLIQDEHLCISQYAVGSKTGPWAFPQRDRTMALVADATVVIEATEKTGTQSQAWEALRLGRRLYVTQSLMDNEDVTWTKKVQEYGAEVLSDDTIDLLTETLPPRLFEPSADSVLF